MSPTLCYTLSGPLNGIEMPNQDSNIGVSVVGGSVTISVRRIDPWNVLRALSSGDPRVSPFRADSIQM